MCPCACHVQAELEFIQSFANPDYLHCTCLSGCHTIAVAYLRCCATCCPADLAQNRYFDDPSFIKYLAYLQYWRELPYCSFIVFPHCLRMLELLQHSSFRTALKRADFKDFIFQQQHWHWKYRVEQSDETGVPAQHQGERS